MKAEVFISAIFPLLQVKTLFENSKKNIEKTKQIRNGSSTHTASYARIRRSLITSRPETHRLSSEQWNQFMQLNISHVQLGQIRNQSLYLINRTAPSHLFFIKNLTTDRPIDKKIETLKIPRTH